MLRPLIKSIAGNSGSISSNFLTRNDKIAGIAFACLKDSKDKEEMSELGFELIKYKYVYSMLHMKDNERLLNSLIRKMGVLINKRLNYVKNIKARKFLNINISRMALIDYIKDNCPACNGSGEKTLENGLEGPQPMTKCEQCDGSGNSNGLNVNETLKECINLSNKYYEEEIDIEKLSRTYDISQAIIKSAESKAIKNWAISCRKN